MADESIPSVDSSACGAPAGAVVFSPPVAGAGAAASNASVAVPPAASSAAAPATRPQAKAAGRPASGPATLPPYTRSLLHIKVPVTVVLAEKRQALGRIVELGPGSIIQFDKSCEEMLNLSVGGRTIASGEAVKVGDKFGLRITSITLPQERFFPVGKRG